MIKKSKLTETQIIAMLNEGVVGVPVPDLCRKYQVSPAIHYKVKSKYAGMNVSELKHLKELEAGNRRLKAKYADISLDNKILQEVLEKKFSELLDEN